MAIKWSCLIWHMTHISKCHQQVISNKQQVNDGTKDFTLVQLFVHCNQINYRGQSQELLWRKKKKRELCVVLTVFCPPLSVILTKIYHHGGGLLWYFRAIYTWWGFYAVIQQPSTWIILHLLVMYFSFLKLSGGSIQDRETRLKEIVTHLRYKRVLTIAT